MTQLLSKLTLKGINAQPKPHSIKEPIALASIYGRARGKTVGQSTFGDFVRFDGEFEGVNTATGEVFSSGQMILPRILESMLAGVVGDGNTVEFAVEIGATPSEKGNTGYEYTVKPLIAPVVSDELLALRAVVQSKALPAPTVEPVAEKKK